MWMSVDGWRDGEGEKRRKGVGGGKEKESCA